MLDVCEIFQSIQGESTFAGYPCTFVRLSGCNLQCTYCDTRYARETGTLMSVADILDSVREYKLGLVEVTGGEPLCQHETPRLLDALCARRYRVLLETNGTCPLPKRRSYVTIMDLKCPGSGESEKVDWQNIGRLQPGDNVKFVLGSRADFDWAARQAARLDFESRGVEVLFGAVARKLRPAQLAEWILDAGINVRLQVQLHRVLWPDVERGV